ncbi:MAG: universal stress protein [Gemmatimonadaceae bacterium]
MSKHPVVLPPVVVAMDFSAASIAAVHWVATHFAPSSPIVAVHAVDIPEPPGFLAPLLAPTGPARELAADGARTRLASLARELPAVSGEVRVGRAAPIIVAVAEERRASAIVIGPHGERTGLGRLIGSTAERVTRNAGVPVVVARGNLERSPVRLLVAVDDSAAGEAALGWAAGVARESGRELLVLHIIDPALAGAVSVAAAPRERASALDGLRLAAEVWLKERLEHTGIPVERREGALRFGDPRAEILAATISLRADLLVVGRGRTGIAGAIGSVADALVRAAEVTTVVVP